MAFQINLNPHTTLRESITLKSKRKSKLADVGAINCVPRDTEGIVRVESRSSMSAFELLCRVLRRHIPNSVAEIRQHKLLGKRVAPNNIGCAIRQGEALFFPPNGKYLLKPGYKWLVDPEKEFLLDKARIDCGDNLTILNLTGNQIAVLEDSQLQRWALTMGMWLIFGPARVISFLPDIEAECRGFASMDEEKACRLDLRRDNWKKIGEALLIGHQERALVNHHSNVVMLGEGIHVLLDPEDKFICTIPTGHCIYNSPLLEARSGDGQELESEVTLSWKFFDPILFANFSREFNVNKILDNHVQSLVKRYCTSLYLDKKGKRLSDRLYNSLLEDMRNFVENELTRQTVKIGIEILGLLIIQCSVK